MKDYEIYNLNFDGTYLDAVSLVDFPAMQDVFLMFKEDEVILRLSIESEEKQEVLGVLIRANFPILRKENKAIKQPHYVQFSEEVIQKVLESNIYNLPITIEHNFNEVVEGAKLKEVFIINRTLGIDPIPFKHISDGSLIGRYKITNKDLWQRIKLGEVKGFSLEGKFNYEPKFDLIQEILNLYK